MQRPILTSLILLVAFPFAHRARADFMEYEPLPGVRVLLEGTYIFNRTSITFRHRLGTLYLTKERVSGKWDVPTFELQFRRLLNDASNAGEAMLAADFALKHGLLEPYFFDACRKAYEFDRQHPAVLKVIELKKRIDVDLGASEKEAAELRQLVRKPSMKIALSDHFILLHDTSEAQPEKFSPNARQRGTRAEERLALLENVYKTFLYKFYSQGVELEVPQERLKVVLFREQYDYNQFAGSISPALSSAIGFYDPKSNTSFFFDHASSKQLKALRELRDGMQEMRAEVIRDRKETAGVQIGNVFLNKADFIRLADTIALLVEIEHENSDIEVVSHEATHQMAGNTGLFPRDVLVPKWVHEGLATYFEAPDDATWSGIGAVNEQRLEWYRALQSDPEHSSLDFVCGDEIFSLAGRHEAILHAYGQGWALTHFLIDRHFDELMTFYRKLGELPPDIVFTPSLFKKIFYSSMKSDPKHLEAEWKSYMKELKTDREILLNSSTYGGRF